MGRIYYAPQPPPPPPPPRSPSSVKITECCYPSKPIMKPVKRDPGGRSLSMHALMDDPRRHAPPALSRPTSATRGKSPIVTGTGVHPPSDLGRGSLQKPSTAAAAKMREPRSPSSDGHPSFQKPTAASRAKIGVLSHSTVKIREGRYPAKPIGGKNPIKKADGSQSPQRPSRSDNRAAAHSVAYSRRSSLPCLPAWRT